MVTLPENIAVKEGREGSEKRSGFGSAERSSPRTSLTSPSSLLFVGLLLGLVGACALLSEGPPENICRTDEDCFRAQGEVCDVEAGKCVPGDGGITVDGAPDAP